ncbi:MAG: protease [Firmicutes bacterium]|nr:protease [Bacillota bacterium]
MSDQDTHKDGFIPKFLLEQLAEKGNEDAKKTIVQMEKIDKKITELKKNNVESSSLSNRMEGHAEREIYDSQNTSQFKRKLVRKEGDLPVADEVVNITYDFCGSTLKYFQQKLNRNSLDGSGMNVICNVHYEEDYNNAFWDERLKQLSFGDGDGKTFINLSRSIDVVAHEMAHAVTDFVNGLNYQRQSGALNEHFSDVLGTAVQQFVKGQTADTADWLIGDEIVGPQFPGKAIRSMKNPGTAYNGDRQVAHMNDYKELPLSDDNGGVHYFSGIPNKAFFLVAMEIGTDQAAFIWYNAWQERDIIHPNATFHEAFEAVLKTAKELVRQGRLPQNTVSAVESAFSKVGIKSLVLV